jgi:hypothetical protein
MVGDDLELVEVKGWESFSCHGALSGLCKLDTDLGLSFPSFFFYYLSKLFPVCDGGVIDHSNDGSFEATLPAANGFVGDSARVALSKYY